ncbi:hypothetical protein G3N55_07300 [Dissulfurirhabdus thermomarina]|uniref:Trk system potassium uptake protein TrkA n=1 Tax=Dissulfurirhabdus thermomarina TaxID=1765737 RepID=A0A6N9TVZ0_DISTH|nr:NAD-binding protein [Dissulfurirhabdus thermomarina]NDY42646.1 hypothetical protein [Dissulfurirhabdus thermomarina]NMX23098.1 hypothetical protein [Dissulfurirhabdus thermomarina]
MKVVITGVGDTGRNLADMLARGDDVELVLVDSDERLCEHLSEELDALVLHGDATDPKLLKDAGLPEADALVCATGTDAINTVIAMLGHRMGVGKIVVKLNDVGLRAACQEIGVTRVIAPKIAAAAEILSTIRGLHRLDFSLVARGGLRLAELDAGAGAGRRLADLAVPGGLLVVAVLRGEQMMVPRGKTRLEAGDVLLTLAEDEKTLERFRELLREATSREKEDEA